jgi:hypothetical protein
MCHCNLAKKIIHDIYAQNQESSLRYQPFARHHFAKDPTTQPTGLKSFLLSLNISCVRSLSQWLQRAAVVGQISNTWLKRRLQPECLSYPKCSRKESGSQKGAWQLTSSMTQKNRKAGFPAILEELGENV